MVRTVRPATFRPLHARWGLGWRHASAGSLRPSHPSISRLRYQEPQRPENGFAQCRAHPIPHALDARAAEGAGNLSHPSTTEDLDSWWSGDGTHGPVQLIDWLERRSEVVLRDGRPDLRAPPDSVLRAGETLLRQLRSAEHRADFTPEALSRFVYYLMEPYSVWELGAASAQLEGAVLKAMLERSRELGLRSFTPADLGRLMVALGSTVRHADKYVQPAQAFLEEMRDECLRRGLQTFRAASLGQMLYGFGKSGFEPGPEFRQACVDRVSKRGFLTRDCTPPDVSFLLWGHWRARHLSCLLGALSSSEIMRPRPDALLCHLLDVLHQRVGRDGPQVLHTSTVGFAARAAARVGRSGGPAARQAATAFLDTMLADVTHSGPSTYLGPTLGTLLEIAWDLDLPQSRDGRFVASLLQEMLEQGVQGWKLSSLCFFLRRVEVEAPHASPHVLGQLVDAAFQRPGLRLDLCRPLLDTLRGFDHPSLDTVKGRIWGHVRRVWDTRHTDATAHQVTAQTLVYVLRGLAGAAVGGSGSVDAPLCAELCEHLVGCGLRPLSHKQRMAAMVAMMQLTHKGGTQEHREVEKRLNDAMLAMWGAEEGGFAPLFESQEGLAELSMLLSGLPFGVVRDSSGALTVLSLAREVYRRHCMSSLRPDAMQGLLLAIVQAHSLLAETQAQEAVAPIGEKGRLLPELMGEIVRHHASRCLVPPRVDGGVSRAASFFATIRSPPFLHALLQLYTAREGLATLSVVELGDLLEFVGRFAPRGEAQGLEAAFHPALAQALLAHDPGEMDLGTLYRLMWSLTMLPDLLPCEDYARRLLSACEEKGLGATTGSQLHTLLEFMYKTGLRSTPGFMRDVGRACSKLRSDGNERLEARKRRISRLMRLFRKPAEEVRPCVQDPQYPQAFDESSSTADTMRTSTI